MKKIYTFTLLAATALTSSATRSTYFSMEASASGTLTEHTTGDFINLYGKHAPENMPGAVGKALRFDGFSSYAQGTIKAGDSSGSALTVSMWVAPETYPVIAFDQATQTKIRMAGTLDGAAKQGWSFNVGYTGKYEFEVFSGGWQLVIEASDLLPCYEWSHLVAVVDCASKKARLYRNGVQVGEKNCMMNVNNAATQITIGRDASANFSGPFMINTFNGLIDEIEVFDTALSVSEFASLEAEHPADLIVASTRFENDKLRPRFHGMPAANWTNECHGMTYSDGRYHLFFQKNANGPYMTRLHWGHISSPNLYDWTEHRVALAPGESYDVKGCWSGCVFTDEAVTGGRPNIIYTGVDYGRAVIAQASPKDEALLNWEKRDGNPIINGRPVGLSDDFRDPYFFRDGDNAYIIVGTSKDGVGACTLHRYNAASGNWSNDGSIFFKGTNTTEHGTFWEMPNITKMENDKWLFTCTPMNTGAGVFCMYWVGTLNADGTFRPDGECKKVELESKYGYAMLSPTIYQHQGKTIALGIVPDKIGGNENYNLGWAHCYSLPREWTLDDKGNLIQKPYAGLAGLRGADSQELVNKSISGCETLEISGRRAEILATFTVGSSDFGFKFFKNGNSEAKLTYRPSTGRLTLDVTALNRWVNDGGSYNGVYNMILPEKPSAGSELKINLFIDGSIVDIFVNDRYAQSVRVFPTDTDAEEIQVFADSPVVVKTLQAWKLQSNGAGIGDILDDEVFECASECVAVYDMFGRVIRTGVHADRAAEGLEKGIYIIGGKKVAIR